MTGVILNNRYELIEKIGVGGMAIVYKAKDLYLKRIVAVKILKEQYIEDKEFIKKFVVEAQSVASLNNINIVRIYDVGQYTENERIYNYIVMEYINGRTLSDLIKEKGRLNSKAVVSITKQIANALDCAHKHHIIHRDIKPHNIIIDGELSVKVTDFGIARISTSSTITYTSSVLGTVHYISPEQAKGKFIDEKSDIYSLGVVMYEMITGKVPFDTDNAVGIALQHINEPLVPPNKFVPALDDWLNDIIVKCMAKNPVDRFQSAADLINALNDMNRVEITNTVYQNPNNQMNKESVYKNSKPSVKVNNNKNREKLTKNKNKGIFDYTITYIILALLLITSVFFIYKLLVKSTVGANVKVPAVVGLKQEDAIKLLKERNLNGLVTSTSDDSDVEPGKVIKQSPEQNVEVKEGTNVELTISVGKNKALVPNLSNIEYDKVEDVLKKNKLVLGKVDREFSDTVEENKVISQSIEFGKEVDAETKVDIVISRGKEDKKVPVPDLMGKTESVALKTLYDNKLKVGKIEKKESDSPKGTVIWQSYGKNVKVDENTEIDIVISSGGGSNESDEGKGVVNVVSSNDSKAIIKTYRFKVDKKSFVLNITRNLSVEEHSIYNKKVTVSGNELIVKLKALPNENFRFYTDDNLLFDTESGN